PRPGGAGRDDVRRTGRGARRRGSPARLEPQPSPLLPEGPGKRPQSAGPLIVRAHSTRSLCAAARGRITEGRDPREVLSALLTEARPRGGFLSHRQDLWIG